MVGACVTRWHLRMGRHREIDPPDAPGASVDTMAAWDIYAVSSDGSNLTFIAPGTQASWAPAY